MVLGFLGNAVAWVLAVWFVAVGVWLFWIGSRMCAGFMNPSRDILAWYTEGRSWTIFSVFNWSIPGLWGLPYGLMVAGTALLLFDFSWMMNKSGLAEFLSGGELLNLLVWVTWDSVMLCGLAIVVVLLGLVMGANAWRKNYVETALVGVASVLAGVWIIYFGFVEGGFEKYSTYSGDAAIYGGSLWGHVSDRTSSEIESLIAGQEGLKSFLLGALCAGAAGIFAFLCMAGLSMLAAVFNALLVLLFTFHPVTFSFGAVGLGAFAVLAFNSVG